MDPQSLRHLHALRDFVRNLVEQAERSGGCECHRPPSLLLVGPPGAGKTYLVKQMSNVCEMPLFGVHTHQLTGPLSLRNLFIQARELDYPSLFFLDDIDYIFSDQNANPCHDTLTESLRNELYKQLGPRKLKIYDSGANRNPVQNSLPVTPSPKSDSGYHDDDSHPDNNGLILVAATSSPWLLYKDHELLSRFRGVYLVGLPDRDTRFHMLKFLLQKVQHNLTEKDFWIVADKTEGYTPSDLMVITKSLNYEQFSFLFSMAGLRGYGDDESSDEGTSMSSSDMTETDTDSNYDPVELPPKIKVGISPPVLGVAGEKEETASHSDSSRKSSPNLDHVPLESKDTTLTALRKDWDSDNEEEEEEMKREESETKDEKDTKGNDEVSVTLTTDGATTNETLSRTEKGDLNDVSSDDPNTKYKEENSADCDNSPTDVVNGETNREDEICKNETEETTQNTDEKKAETSLEDCDRISESDENLTQITPSAPEIISDVSDNETREFELHVYHPPDPFRNDNQAVDSGSDSDNENSCGASNFSKRNRRVNFGNVTSMHSLTVNVDDQDDINFNNNNYDYDSNVPDSNMNDSLISKDSYCGPSSNNILKRLLTGSSPLPDDKGNIDNDLSSSKTTVSKNGSPLTKQNNYSQDEYHDVYATTERDRISDTDDNTSNLTRFRKENKSPETPTYPRSPSLRRNSLSEDNRSSTGAVSPQLASVSPQLTPSGSVNSNILTAENSSDSGSGRIQLNSDTGDNEVNKTRESNSSLYGKSETPTIPSSDTSSATCNVSGETLECRSDSDERLRNLDEDLKGRRARNSISEDDEDISGDETENDALRTILNLNNLGEVSIKILTLNDVLNVVNRTPRSVSDEEIKRYTDFMVWFAGVAKSACPHSNKGAVSDTASSFDESVDGSLWNSSTTTTKKRKGPLRKLGRFLLKALMFILD